MKKKIFMIIFVIVSVSLFSSIRIASYNALNYSDDDPDFRLPSFSAVLGAMDVDIIIFQEIQNEEGGELLLGALNNSGEDFAGTQYINGLDSNNYLVYNTETVSFAAQDTIMTDLRDISVYEMIVNGTFFRIFSCHLKAGSDDADEAQRLAEVTTLREYINNLEPQSEFLILGDMNIYTSSEAAYQKFIADEADNTSRSEDLCDMVGNWHNSSAYASVHTQSTRSGSGGNAGGSGGGMDDRFDFIFANYGVNDGNGLEYIDNSLTAYGNDGEHFNQSINEGTNNAVPANIATALYNASDHLPVYADFDVLAGSEELLIMSIPNIREFWQRNTEYTVRWASSNITGNVMLELISVPSGEAETLIASTENDGEWEWSIPEDMEMADYKVRVTSLDNTDLYDESNNYFTIVEQHNPDLMIYDIQYTTEAGSDGTYPSPLVEQTVTVTGIVTGANFNEDNKFFLSDPQGGAWSGVYVFDYQTGPQVGDEVEITAIVQEYYGFTELSYAESIDILSSGNTVPEPIELTCAEFSPTSGSSEQYEGCLLKFTDVTVVSEQDAYGQWYVDDGTGTIQVDDGFFKFDELNPPFQITMGMNFPYLIGCADYSFDEYAIHPRSMADIDLSNSAEPNEIPAIITDLTNFPNPFNPETMISFNLKKAGNVSLRIYNSKGQEIKTLADGFMNSGNQEIIWNGTNQNGETVASGIYVSKLIFGNEALTGKLILMK